MRYTFFVVLMACNLILTNLLQPVFAAGETLPAAQEEPPAEQQPQTSGEEQQTSVINFYTWAAMLPNDLMDLQSSLKSDKYDDIISKELPEVTADIRDLQWNVNMAKSSPNLQKMQVDTFQAQLSRLQSRIAKLERPLTEVITRLSVARKEWNAKKEKLKSYAKMEDLSLAMAIEEKEELGTIIDEAIDLIEKHLEPALIKGKELANFQVRLHTIGNDLHAMNTEVIAASTQRTSPSILSGKFYKQFNTSLFIDTYANSKEFLLRHLTSLKNNVRFIIPGLFLFTVFCGCLSLSRNLVTASSYWYPFATCPLATAVFILTSTYSFLNKQINVKLGDQWDYIITILSLLAVIRLVKHCIDDAWRQMLFSRLALFMVITMVTGSLRLPQFLMLIFVVGASIMALMLYLYQLPIKCDSNWQRFVRKSWGIIPALIIVASLTGYDQLAIVAFTTLIASVATCLVIWMLYHVNFGLLELLLTITPFTLLQDNVSVIVRSLQPFIALAHLILTCAILTVIWDIYPSVDIALQEIGTFGFNLGGFHVSPGVLLTIYVVLFGSLLFSRAVQALLMNEVLPRYSTGKGVQISINRLVHYAILLIGFIIMLRFLGFDLKQLTLLGGALSIGIGFGLQAIVNNFTSGLILLFERPIKVGDTIQVGTDLGEVKKLGLRSTIIQTFDNAEIVVPNSDLITGQVTNWTLAERKVRIKIPVGVAYGTDVAKVLEILQTCADLHPMVLSTPKPVALFLAFGASSLDFELRIWIPEYLDKLTATSELNQSIESEFALNNIEIPFLQTDLHIRSVDAAAAMALSGRQVTEKTEEKKGKPEKSRPEELSEATAEVQA